MQMRSVSNPLVSVIFSRRPFVKVPGAFLSISFMHFSSAPRRPRSLPKIMSCSLQPCRPPLSPSFVMKNMSVPHASSMRPSVARRLPVIYPMQSLGTSTTVQSSRSCQPFTYTGPSSWPKSHLMYSLARRRSWRVPEKSATCPTYCTIACEARSSFFLVLPCLPRAYESSSSWKVMVSVPQVPVESMPLSRPTTSSRILLK
mmetsp:Transcript_86314/g.166146  ORF Transcript_86314/g.166146 Transcript_86314/m.166146 type:complete len:201 (+) Transcript_86314:708-1310(+)